MSDLISRQAAIDVLDVLCQEHRYKIPGKIETYSQYNEAWQDALDRAEGAIFNLPSAESERKKGKWNQIISIPNDMFGRYYCSECGKEGNPFWYFCPNCGADMKGEKYETD